MGGWEGDRQTWVGGKGFLIHRWVAGWLGGREGFLLTIACTRARGIARERFTAGARSRNPLFNVVGLRRWLERRGRRQASAAALAVAVLSCSASRRGRAVVGGWVGGWASLFLLCC